MPLLRSHDLYVVHLFPPISYSFINCGHRSTSLRTQVVIRKPLEEHTFVSKHRVLLLIKEYVGVLLWAGHLSGFRNACVTNISTHTGRVIHQKSWGLYLCKLTGIHTSVRCKFCSCEAALLLTILCVSSAHGEQFQGHEHVIFSYVNHVHV